MDLPVLDLRYSLSLHKEGELAYIEVPKLDYFISSEDARALTALHFKGFLEITHVFFSQIHDNKFFIIPDGVRYDPNFIVEVELILKK